MIGKIEGLEIVSVNPLRALSWERDIVFTYKDVQYDATLSYDEYNGYSLHCFDQKNHPDFSEIDDFYFTLDEMAIDTA